METPTKFIQVMVNSRAITINVASIQSIHQTSKGCDIVMNDSSVIITSEPHDVIIHKIHNAK